MKQLPDYIPEDLTYELPSPLRVLDMRLPDGELVPREGDRIVIIPMYDDPERACRIASVFREAGILTLGVSATDVPDRERYFDSVMIIEECDSDYFTGFLEEIIESHGPVDITVADIDWLFRNSGRCKMETAPFSGYDDLLSRASDDLFPHLKAMNLTEGDKVLVAIFFDAKNKDAITAERMERFVSHFAELPAEADIMWGLLHQEDLGPQTITIVTFISGKNIKPYED